MTSQPQKGQGSLPGLPSNGWSQKLKTAPAIPQTKVAKQRLLRAFRGGSVKNQLLKTAVINIIGSRGK